MTVDEMRDLQVQKEREQQAEEKRLKEKVLCAEVTLPPKDQKFLGISGFTMKASELEEWVERELNYGDRTSLTVTVKFSIRTNKWIESLPEADT